MQEQMRKEIELLKKSKPVNESFDVSAQKCVNQVNMCSLGVKGHVRSGN